MDETTNLHLTKDAETDHYSVSRVNANSDRIDQFAGSVNTALSGKVDKISGKGLSTEDFSTAEKTKLAGLENYDDSALQAAVNAFSAALNPAAYIAPTITGNTNFALQCGGYQKIGKLVVVNFRIVISGTNTITKSSGAIATGFPAPLWQPVASGVTIGGESQLVAVSCSPSIGDVMNGAALAILGNGNLIVASGSIETTTFTVFSLGAAYLCQ